MKDIAAGARNSSPTAMTNLDATTVLFSATGLEGAELWTSDGTSAGMRLVKDIYSGGGSSRPDQLTCIDGKLYFAATTRSESIEPWISDGTAAGTKRTCDLYAGPASSGPARITRCGGSLFFAATDERTGVELHGIDAPGAMAVALGDEGSAKSFSTLRSTAPVLGGTARHAWGSGPSGHIGLIVLGGSTGSYSFPILFNGCVAVDWRTYLTIGIATPPAGEFALPLPAVTDFAGIQVNTQIWRVSLTTVLPIEVTNGVQLTLGK